MTHKARPLTLAATGTGPLSPEHKRFQALLAKIDKARERLAQWQQHLPLYHQVHQAQVVPLQTALNQERHEWALQLEQLQLSHKWSKADSRSLSDLICDICGGLMSGPEEPDPEIKALFNRHSPVDFDTETELHLQDLKSLVERVAGVDLGDAPVHSMDDLLQQAQELRAKAEQERERAGETRRRHKPARKTAAQKRAEEEQGRISQTVREVYRKLASALHPDRLPADTPEAQRLQVNERMQRANAAYAAGDLLALLELQLQIEQVDLAHASRMAAEQVRHFNKVLAEQLRELEAEVDERQHAFCDSYGVMTHRRLNPEELGELLKEHVRQLLDAQGALRHDRRQMLGNPAYVKAYLKQWRLAQRAEDW